MKSKIRAWKLNLPKINPREWFKFPKTFIAESTPIGVLLSPLTIDKYQEETRKTVQYDKDGATETQQLLYLGCALAGEVGELCNKLKKVHRDGTKLDVEDLQYEIGDIYWYLARIEDMFQIVPSDTLQKNLDKLQGRKERGTLGGSGDDR